MSQNITGSGAPNEPIRPATPPPPPPSQLPPSPGTVDRGPSRSRAMVFPLVLLLFVVAAIGASLYFVPDLNPFGGDEIADVPEAVEGLNANPPDPDPEAAEVSRQLRDDLDALARRFDAIDDRLVAMPDPSEEVVDPDPEAPDLNVELQRLRGQVQELGKLPEALAELTRKLEDLGATQEGTAGRVAELSAAIDTLREETQEAKDLAMPGRQDDSDLDGELDRAAQLYNGRQYDQALEMLGDLQQSQPEDARVWYYSALSHAFSTSDWQGETTKELFEKGIERERAGTPSAEVIDATFADLDKARGADWLGFYRNQARR